MGVEAFNISYWQTMFDKKSQNVTSISESQSHLFIAFNKYLHFTVDSRSHNKSKYNIQALL